MTLIEIILLIIGMLFILASFWMAEKLSPEELRNISELSKEEMGVMLEHELDRSKQKVTDMVEDTIDASKEQTERSLEKQTNEKIMAISEYSDTVLEKMNKAHNEIMFLYSMLNDKHTELTNFSTELTQQLQDFKSQGEELASQYLTQLQTPPPVIRRQNTPNVIEPIYVYDPQEQEAVPLEEKAAQEPSEFFAPQGAASQGREETEEENNVRREIIRLYEDGKDSVAIAKKLGMGVGEVRLILGLYKGDA